MKPNKTRMKEIFIDLTWADEAFFPHSAPVMFFTSSPYTTNERRLITVDQFHGLLPFLRS
jgi:hypothetical protein